jgi:hypothetical protein
VRRLLAQRKEDGGTDGTSAHAAPAAPTTSSAAPADSGAAHGVRKEMLVQLFVVVLWALVVVMAAIVIVWMWHVVFLLVGKVDG